MPKKMVNGNLRFRPGEMSTRRQHTAFALLALSCAVFTAVAPVIPQIHWTFTYHRHVYCLEHHRFEDADPKQTSVPPSSSRDDASHVAASKNAPAGGDSRPECLFSNLVFQIVPCEQPPCCISLPFEDRQPQVADVADIPNIEIVLFAPKHSPPGQRSS